jgi:peptidoglycan-associated lipoprotein
MKMIKQLTFVLLAGAIATFSSACSWWESSSEEEVSQFYQPDDGMARAGKSGAGLDGNDNIDLTGLQGGEGQNGLKNGADGVDAWGSGAQGGKDGAYIDGFGARIAGVNFEPVYFSYDRNDIRQSEEHKLKAVADYLKGNAKAGIVIEGNCDSRGTTEYNRNLGEKRAIAAKTFLMAEGIEESRIKTISYGKERPAVQGDDETARAQNRRDEFVPVYLLK